ncbi:MAG TPA: hypothetical protein VHY08_27330 [Bacillota bacterium]|nr:hypothetical protein [Bacillota bacterium]
MKITDSNITMIGQRQYQETSQITETRMSDSPPVIKLAYISLEDAQKADQLQISDPGRKALLEAQGKELMVNVYNIPREKLRLQVLSRSLSVITDGTVQVSIGIPRRPLTTQVQVQRREVYRESEQTSFTANGVVKTADGKEIDFSVALNMSREFAMEKITSTVTQQQLKDPLVINFDGPAAALSDTKFSFDLDNDGALDQISFLKSGSGFLALDQNQDGVINNGGELFGTASGNGFADLLKYDSDQNGWIDENDAIYEKLRIWTKDENGQDVLFALGQKGIGAIYLGNTETQFSMKDAANQTQGQIRRTGVFLKEDGTAGTVQQIDLVV